MHKPKGVYTTNVAQGETNAGDRLAPPESAGAGLSSGPAGFRIARRPSADQRRRSDQPPHPPRYGVAKTYRAVVDGFVKPETIAPLEKGVWLADPRTGKGFKTGQARIKIVSRAETKACWK